MKPIKGYKEATATSFSKAERLPAGGYVLKVLDVKEESYDWGDVIILRFDIAEGEQKGFFDRRIVTGGVSKPFDLLYCQIHALALFGFEALYTPDGVILNYSFLIGLVTTGTQFIEI